MGEEDLTGRGGDSISTAGGKEVGMEGLESTLSSLAGDMAAGMAGGPIGIAVTAIMKIGEVIVQLMTKLVNMIIDSSPYLQGVLKIIDKMFKLVLMPVGNMIARILLPLAVKMANKTMALLQKYSNAGPEEMINAASDGFTVIIDSMVEMIGTVLGKALWPLIVGGVKALGNILTGQSPDYNSPYSSATSDLESLLGSSSSVLSSTMDQFGLTILTGNKMVQSSTGELATVIYSGASSIEDGFQSNSNVLAIGTTGALNSLNAYNIANAGMVTVVNTTTASFANLNLAISQLADLIQETLPEETPEPEKKSGGGWNPLQWLAFGMSPVLASGYMLATGEPLGGKGSAFDRRWLGNSSTVDISNNSNTNSGTGTVNVTFNGDVYGMDDFDSKVQKSVSKYSNRTGSAY
jgi:hypothetical protein